MTSIAVLRNSPCFKTPHYPLRFIQVQLQSERLARITLKANVIARILSIFSSFPKYLIAEIQFPNAETILFTSVYRRPMGMLFNNYILFNFVFERATDDIIILLLFYFIVSAYTNLLLYVYIFASQFSGA